VGDPPPSGSAANDSAPKTGDLSTGEGSHYLAAAARARSVAAKISKLPGIRRPAAAYDVKLNHARVSRSFAPPPLDDVPFVQNFSQSALGRQPYGNEQSYWNDILRVAHARGQGAPAMAGRELGKALFESAEYAARNRDNHWFVNDLYKAYLRRDPDSGGWAYWESVVPSQGREAVRRAFDESAEFLSIIATVAPTGAPGNSVSSLLSARVDLSNQPGGGLLTRDTSFTLPLLTLPGRSGMDLGLTLSYSSMIWTRSGPYIYFDEDNGAPSPGFRLGFPVVQEQFFDAQVGQNAYLVLKPSGGRTELRQIGSSNIFEAADSSYLQLIDYGTSLLLRSSDGTQLSYAKLNNEWRCSQVKDRNGNYFSVNYNWMGQLAYITDTLARVIAFNYDNNANLQAITQTWNGQTHQWATFGWGSQAINTAFSGVAAVGLANGQTIPVLTQVGLADGSRYNFDYNSRGQITYSHRYTADNIQRTYAGSTYETPADDCPRLSMTRLWADNWTGINGVPYEVTTQYGIDNGWRTMLAPDGTLYRETHGTGWQNGLVTQTEVWSGGVRQKWTTTSWTQDNLGVNYQTNPRATETNLSDVGGNHRRSTISYTTFNLPSGASCSLPNNTHDYLADGITVYRRTHTDYLLSTAYLDKRLIGLPDTVILYDSGNTRLSETHYGYDWSSNLEDMPGGVNPVQHDASYGTSFNIRGNLVITTRNSVDPNPTPGIEMKYGYNVAGSTTFTRDMLWHQSFFTYGDSFSDGVNNRNTFAYPTMLADSDWNATYLRYNFDFGATTRHKGPPASGQSQGAIQTFDYDGAGRLERTTMTDNGAYTRYLYGPSYVQSYSTLNNVADDSYTIQTFDGMGRMIGMAGYHPGSAGGFKGQITVYDVMGRAMKQSNPTEITSAWAPVGDDAVGWLFTQFWYDWKGRLSTTANVDWTQKHATYSGCGCAGGEVVTLTDEVFRRQRIHSDVFGRKTKIEVLNGDDSVYSTLLNIYNQRDDVIFSNSYQGAATSDGSCPANTCQQTAMTYDGYGRLKTKHVPEQNAGAAATYEYLADDAVQKITDARGASATYAYNGRHQVTNITYAAPAGITPTANVSYNFDAAGNRTSMSDGQGSVTYSYDVFSRITSETRSFNGLGSFTLGYEYNLGGKLKKVTDPFNASINYSYDQTGRVNGVTGTGFGSVSDYASGIQYRATNSLKRVVYGPSSYPQVSSIAYDSRMRAQRMEIRAQSTNTLLQSEEYQYYNDNSVHFVQRPTNPQQDRSYVYDQTGRFVQALTGQEARGETVSDPTEIPFGQNYAYDAWGNLTSRTGKYWGQNVAALTATYANNRNTAWSYDAEGNLVQEGNRQHGFDAAGHDVSATEPPRRPNQPGLSQTQSYDGDGRRVRQMNNGISVYELRATALGGALVTELNAQGVKVTGYVYSNGELLAKQYQPDNRVIWIQHSPAGTGDWRSMSDTIGVSRAVELDPLFNDVGVEKPDSSGGGGATGNSYPDHGDPVAPNTCALNDDVLPCDYVFKVLRRDHFQMMLATITGRIGARVPLQTTTATWDGSSTASNVEASQDPNGTWSASMTITAGPDVFKTETVGYATQTVTLQSTHQFFFAAVAEGQGRGRKAAAAPPSLFSTERLRWCLLNKFSVDFYRDSLEQNPSFDVSRSRGYFYGTWAGHFISVQTNMTSVDSAYIRAAVPRVGTSLPGGFTSPNDPEHNFVASNVAASYPFEMVRAAWVHELGVALGEIVSRLNGQDRRVKAKNPALRQFDEDSGMALEECVYNGKVVTDDRGNVFVTQNPVR
jgi:YD repeat-containing protein